MNISLTKNQTAIIDDADYPLVSPYKWCCSRQGYAVTSTKDPLTGRWNTVLMHRLIMKPPKGKHIDHINGNRTDNRRANLRICLPSENHVNMLSHRDSRNPYKGIRRASRKIGDKVYWSKWRARIQHNGKACDWGPFDTPEAAARAYDAKAKELFGPFAKLNFPESANLE